MNGQTTCTAILGCRNDMNGWHYVNCPKNPPWFRALREKAERERREVPTYHSETLGLVTIPDRED